MATQIHFGTSGWRAVMAEEFTFANVRRAVTGIARYVVSQKPSGARVIVGRDPRFLGETFCSMASEILIAHGVTPLMIADPAPTPAISYAVIQQKADGAINFTASHNPPEYNGIKFSTPDGAPALPEATKRIEAEIAASDAAGEQPTSQNKPVTACGNPTKASRFGDDPAAVSAHAVAAGFIASRSGSAIVAPTPFNTVRRATCFLKYDTAGLRLFRLFPGHRAARSTHTPHPELFALDDRLDDRRKPIIASCRAAHNPADGGHVVGLQLAARRIRQQSLGKRLHELLGAAQQRLAQVVGTVDRRAVGQLT